MSAEAIPFFLNNNCNERDYIKDCLITYSQSWNKDFLIQGTNAEKEKAEALAADTSKVPESGITLHASSLSMQPAVVLADLCGLNF